MEVAVGGERWSVERGKERRGGVERRRVVGRCTLAHGGVEGESV